MSILHIITLIFNILSVCTIMILGILFCCEFCLGQLGRVCGEDSRIQRLGNSIKRKHAAMGIALFVAACYHSIWSFWRHGLSVSSGTLTGVFLLGVVGSYLMRNKLGDCWVLIHKICAVLFVIAFICHIV